MARHGDSARTRKRNTSVRLEIELLESRVVPTAGVTLIPGKADYLLGGPLGPDPDTVLPAASSGTSGVTSPQAGPTYSLSNVPAMSSLPGAQASIYLNFTGETVSQWGGYANIVVPAYDQDGDPSTFSSGELASIQETWQVVAEKYAPFDINVTTVKPANLGHGFTQQIDIGGNGSWLGATYGGISYTGSFASAGLPNLSFVFPANLANGDPIDTADSASHEAGHAFGLSHQSQWDSSGNLVAEYYAGSNGNAPIMGYAYGATRALWWNGTSDIGPIAMQDDLSVISSSTNGFGYRPEPANRSAAAATPLTVSGTQVSGSGVIIHTTDQDYFSFTTGAGQVTLSVSTQAAGINCLAPTIKLLGPDGHTVLASNDPSPSFTATVSVNVPAGTYYVVVGSHGGYDDLGQYTVSGVINGQGQSAPGTPGGVAASAGNGQATLTWNGVSGATSNNIYRGTSAGGEGSTPYQSGVSGTSFTDNSVNNGTTYYYQVVALNSTGSSGRSAEVSATPQGQSTSGPIAIDAGGGAVGSFLADTDSSGGSSASVGATINTSGVSNPAPQAVYQSVHYGNFSYTVPGLTAGSSYTVRLDFAEIYWTSAGQRLFNVLINGSQVLTSFDIFAAAGGANIAIAKSFTATADSSGKITLQFVTVRDNAMINGIEITAGSSGGGGGGSGSALIDAGGGAAGSFLADMDSSGGSSASVGATINTSGVSNPAPQAVYQSVRYGNFTYTIPGLTAGGSYTVRLDFAEIYWTSAGQRLFNVLINGSQVLTSFDIFAAAGGANIAIAKSFTATADSSGKITLQFVTVRDNAMINGIEITAGSSGGGSSGGGGGSSGSALIDAGGGAAGSFLADTDSSGGSSASVGATINTSGVSNPAPQAVYQSVRYGNFSYTVPGLTAGGSYTVRLDFAEIYWNSAGQRLFNVLINGSQVLTSFDIFAAAGGANIAIAKSFTATADSSGKITLQFVTVRDNAMINGIEITPGTGALPAHAPPASGAGFQTYLTSTLSNNAEAGPWARTGEQALVSGVRWLATHERQLPELDGKTLERLEAAQHSGGRALETAVDDFFALWLRDS